jgi:hypothetical protein
MRARVPRIALSYPHGEGHPYSCRAFSARATGSTFWPVSCSPSTLSNEKACIGSRGRAVRNACRPRTANRYQGVAGMFAERGGERGLLIRRGTRDGQIRPCMHLLCQHTREDARRQARRSFTKPKRLRSVIAWDGAAKSRMDNTDEFRRLARGAAFDGGAHRQDKLRLEFVSQPQLRPCGPNSEMPYRSTVKLIRIAALVCNPF